MDLDLCCGCKVPGSLGWLCPRVRCPVKCYVDFFFLNFTIKFTLFFHVNWGATDFSTWSWQILPVHQKAWTYHCWESGVQGC